MSYKIPLIDDLKHQKKKLKNLIIIVLIVILIFILGNIIGNYILKASLKNYYGLNIPAKLLCIGHSHTVLGIDKVLLEESLNVPVAKYCFNGANTADRLIMLKHFVESNGNNLKAVIYDVDAHAFTAKGLSSNSYQLFYPFIGDIPAIDNYIKDHANTKEYWIKKAIPLTRYDDTRLNAALRGIMSKWGSIKYRSIDVQSFQRKIDSGNFNKISFDKDNMITFEETLKYINDKGIELYLLYIPTIDILNNAEPAKYNQAVGKLQSLSDKYKHVTFLNYNPLLASDHTIFFDSVHLNRKGQKLVTTMLAKDLNTLF